MRALIIGGDSRLGQALVPQLLLGQHEVICTSRRADRRSSDVFFDMLEPRLATSYCSGWRMFIVAAVTGIVKCERDPDAWRINADAPARLARHALNEAIFVSSDAVEIAPHTAYAKQKAYAELAVLAAGGSVLRPAAITSPEAYESVAKALVALVETGNNELRRWRA
jgi:dTDP-4-dehydrorhamnose reductase